MKKSTKVIIWVLVAVALVAAGFGVYKAIMADAAKAGKALDEKVQPVWAQTTKLAENVTFWSAGLKNAYSVYKEEMDRQAAAEEKKRQKQRKLAKAKKEEVKKPEKPAYESVYESWLKADEELRSKSEGNLPIGSHTAFDKVYGKLVIYGQALENLTNKIPAPQHIKLVFGLFKSQMGKIKKSMDDYNVRRKKVGRIIDDILSVDIYPKKYPPMIPSE